LRPSPGPAACPPPAAATPNQPSLVKRVTQASPHTSALSSSSASLLFSQPKLPYKILHQKHRTTASSQHTQSCKYLAFCWPPLPIPKSLSVPPLPLPYNRSHALAGLPSPIFSRLFAPPSLSRPRAPVVPPGPPSAPLGPAAPSTIRSPSRPAQAASPHHAARPLSFQLSPSTKRLTRCRPPEQPSTPHQSHFQIHSHRMYWPPLGHILSFKSPSPPWFDGNCVCDERPVRKAGATRRPRRGRPLWGACSVAGVENNTTRPRSEHPHPSWPHPLASPPSPSIVLPTHKPLRANRVVFLRHPPSCLRPLPRRVPARSRRPAVARRVSDEPVVPLPTGQVFR